jgi:hypothetical protein
MIKTWLDTKVLLFMFLCLDALFLYGSQAHLV